MISQTYGPPQAWVDEEGVEKVLMAKEGWAQKHTSKTARAKE